MEKWINDTPRHLSSLENNCRPTCISGGENSNCNQRPTHISSGISPGCNQINIWISERKRRARSLWETSRSRSRSSWTISRRRFRNFSLSSLPTYRRNQRAIINHQGRVDNWTWDRGMSFMPITRSSMHSRWKPTSLIRDSYHDKGGYAKNF